jgi:hypothetical protein
MFGDERGGGTNVRFGLKPMKNAEAQTLYLEEVEKLIRDLNMRYIRARLPEASVDDAEKVLEQILTERSASKGIAFEDLLHAPHPEFFRRRGVPAFRLIGVDGKKFRDVGSYLGHLSRHLPDAYRSGRDFRHYVDLLRRVHDGELETVEAVRSMPMLRRVGGVCPCSKSVRWITDNGERPPQSSGVES